MKKFLLYLALLCPLTGLWAQTTAGYHRVSKVLARAPQTVTAQVVPYATVSITSTATGAAAVIYSDPGLSVQISPAVVTADASGNYSYYLPLNYMVTETISSPGQGSVVIPNVGENGGGGSSGVSQIIAGTNVAISPSAGTGAVTINATGGGGSYPGVTTDGANGLVVTGKVEAANLLPKFTPWADVRAFGGTSTCNGSTDDTAAFQAAVTALGVAGGVLYAPNCYVANPQAITWPNYGSVVGSLVIKIQGTLKVGATFPAHDYVDFVGEGGAQGNQFWSGPLGAIQGPTTVGTLGTTVSAGSQTFAPSTMSGIYPGTTLTIAEQTTCAISSISRANNVVTATFASSCTVAPGLNATIASVSNTSFNGTFLVTASDYVLNTLIWQQTASNATSSGGTATGYSENKYENVVVTGTTSSTATATFVYPHASTAIWGIVGMYMTGWGEHTLRGISVNSSGVGIVQYWTSNAHFYNVTAGGLYGPTSWGLEVNESFTNYYDDSVFQNFNGNSSWGVRVTNTNLSTPNPAGNLHFKGGSISGGMKLDRGSGYTAGNIYLDDVIIEQPTRGAFAVDTSAGPYLSVLSLTNSMLQDNLNGYSECVITSLYPTPQGTLTLKNVAGDVASLGCVANTYFNGRIEYDNWMQAPTLWTANAKPIHATNGAIVEEELRGINAGLQPSLIPYATQPVPAVTTWSSNGNCTVTSGTLSPDGTADAVTVTAVSTGGTMNPYTYTYTPAVGDTILFGGWFQAMGTTTEGGNYTGLGLLGIDTAGQNYSLEQGGGPYGQAGTQLYSMSIYGDWWHPSVGYAKVTQADGAAHPVRMQVQCSPTGAVKIWNAWMMVVPASAGFSDTEMARWRQQLMHGYVPPGASAGTLATTSALAQSISPVQSLTTTGTSGAATLSSGVLNIPQYTASNNFSALTSGTNTTATMLVGTGASLAPTGTGTISANATAGMVATGGISFTTGSVALTWNGDTGLSRTGGPGVICAGNGSVYDCSGTLRAAGGVFGTSLSLSGAGVLANCGKLTTTAAASDALSCAWVTSSSTCTVTPISATAPAWTYITPSAGSVTVYHSATAITNAYSIACSAN